MYDYQRIYIVYVQFIVNRPSMAQYCIVLVEHYYNLIMQKLQSSLAQLFSLIE